MQCPNHGCGVAVDDGVRVCPQCGMDMKPPVAPGPSEGDNLGTEALAQASHSGRVRKLANASLILAILSCPLFGVALYILFPSFVLRLLNHSLLSFPVMLVIASFMGLAAVVTGHMAIAKGKRVPGTGGVPWRPLFGTVLGYLNIVVPIMLIAFVYFNKWRPNMDLTECGRNLRQVNVFVFQKYADENEGMYPPLSSQPGVLMFSAEAVPPKDNTDPLSLTCPTIRYAKQRTTGPKASDKPASPYDDQSYFYLGYAVRDDDDVEAFAQAYRKKIAEGGTFDEDLVVQDGEETLVLPRLSRAVLRASHWSGPPYQSPGVPPTDGIPLLIERDLGHRLPDTDDRMRGGNVLYLNHKTYFVERGTWPMTEKTQRILAELAE